MLQAQSSNPSPAIPCKGRPSVAVFHTVPVPRGIEVAVRAAGWEYEATPDPDFIARLVSSERCQALVLWCPSLEDRGLDVMVPNPIRVGSCPSYSALVTRLRPPNFRALASIHVSEVMILGLDDVPGRLSDALERRALPRALRRLAAEVSEIRPLPGVIRWHLVSVCHEGPATPVPTVPELAARIGCSVSYLGRVTRAADVRLGALLRLIRLLRGLGLQAGGQTSAHVAKTLGFFDTSGWHRFVVRLTDCTPGRAAGEPLGRWLDIVTWHDRSLPERSSELSPLSESR